MYIANNNNNIIFINDLVARLKYMKYIDLAIVAVAAWFRHYFGAAAPISAVVACAGGTSSPNMINLMEVLFRLYRLTGSAYRRGARGRVVGFMEYSAGIPYGYAGFLSTDTTMICAKLYRGEIKLISHVNTADMCKIGIHETDKVHALINKHAHNSILADIDEFYYSCLPNWTGRPHPDNKKEEFARLHDVPTYMDIDTPSMSGIVNNFVEYITDNYADPSGTPFGDGEGNRRPLTFSSTYRSTRSLRTLMPGPVTPWGSRYIVDDDVATPPSPPDPNSSD